MMSGAPSALYTGSDGQHPPDRRRRRGGEDGARYLFTQAHILIFTVWGVFWSELPGTLSVYHLGHQYFSLAAYTMAEILG